MNRVQIFVSLSLLLSPLLVLDEARSATYVLTLGGGSSPLSNQISLEKNVQYFQRVLAAKAPGAARHDIYFSDGRSVLRDLQYEIPNQQLPKVNRLMAQLFGKTSDLQLAYRNHQISQATTATGRKQLGKWFAEVGSQMQTGDRLLLYITMHGGKSKDKEKPFATSVRLWNGESLATGDLAMHLDRLPAGVEVVSVMVQCYSGGFSHLIFSQSDENKGLAKHLRCGFFATVHDRPAAGCTPDVNEANYQEYSSFFWEALSGRSRIGETVQAPDYDQDGKTSFAEAHAYAILKADTIDIPIATSGALLRKYSRLQVESSDDKNKTSKQPGEGAARGEASADNPRNEDLITLEVSFSGLLALATDSEKAVLQGLSQQLQLQGEQRIEQARQRSGAIKNQRKSLAKQIGQEKRRQQKLREVIARDMKKQWPELENRFSLRVTHLLTDEQEEFVAAVTQHKDYRSLVGVSEKIESLGQQRLDLERRWAKCQRLIRTAENVALAANLEKFAREDILARFKQLRALENSTLSAR